MKDELELSGVSAELGFDKDLYPALSKYARIMPPPSRPVVGRKHEMRRLLASLKRPELSNAFLLGDAGSGKTMLVQGVSIIDTNRTYVEVDLPKMAASEAGEDGAIQMATRIKSLFEDSIRFRKDTEVQNKKRASEQGLTGDLITEIVLFIDEFHLLVQLSVAAAQAIKPILAESGRLGVRIIAATTFAEFHDFVENDQALMQRLQRINIREPDKEVVVEILKSISESHGVNHDIYDTQLYELIYEYSNRYIPADSQPRKAILLLDSMIGWYRAYPEEFHMDRHLLGSVIYDSVGVKVTFEIDGRSIQRSLNKRIYSQEYATMAIEQRLQIAVADLHDKSRPISSFLFTGPTGCGKTEMVKGLASLLFGDEKNMIRFDMSEYALANSLDRFREELTSEVWNNSHSIVLFDEVEKANAVITRLMLQVLDDGRLSNRQGREVSFLNTYIVLTTNAGSEVYNNIAHYATDDTGANGLADYQKVIRQSLIANDSFAPEIINRMNAVIPFQPLSINTYEKIVENKLKKLKDEVYRVHGIELSIRSDVIDYIVRENFDIDTDSGGARGLVSKMDVEIVSPLSRYINKHPDVKRIGVLVKGRMAFQHPGIRVSEAKIVVGTFDSKKARHG